MLEVRPMRQRARSRHNHSPLTGQKKTEHAKILMMRQTSSKNVKGTHRQKNEYLWLFTITSKVILEVMSIFGASKVLIWRV